MVEQTDSLLNAAGDQRHVEISFFCKDTRIGDIPSAVYDVPVSATLENLNALVNRTIHSTNASWSDRRFEFLVGETFIRSTLAEFIEEYNVETESVLNIECILGKETPTPLHDITAPDWISSITISSSYLFSTTYSGEVLVIDRNGEKVLENQRDKGSALKCGVLMRKDIESKKLEGHQIVTGGENQILTLYEIENNAMIPKTVFRGHERSVECVDVNKECSRLVSGAFDSMIKVWNLECDQATVYEKDIDSDHNPKKRKEKLCHKGKDRLSFLENVITTWKNVIISV
ncbi:hypothetical protein KIN20_017793 [Parelaphostrongylus tenuis]|uniref:NLE domain-containing protein n=1 Tax=Parelaphostrongylus tenuis TaxID=148309 RepID=A0AAD5QRP7_PARTN|nr:hypothetical protein KIN20_017793 [Parelaphostrongylus tenuis]